MTARKLVSGSALRVANIAATALVAVLIMPFVVHNLGDRLYGIWTLVATFIGYFPLLDLGLSTAVVRYLASALGQADDEQANRVFNTALRIYSGLGAIVLVVTCVLAALAPLFFKSREDASLFSQTIFIVGLSIAVLFPSRVFSGVLEAHLRFDRVAILDLLTLGLRTTLIVVLLLSGYKVAGLAWATFLASIPSMILTVYFSRKELPFLRFGSKYGGHGTARSLFSYSAFSLIAALANVLRFRVDNIVVASFVGLAAVTHYRIGGTLVQYFFLFMNALLGMFTSVFSRKEGAKDHEAIRKTYFFASKISICIASFVAFGMIAWGKPFIARWMGVQYLDAYPVLVALVVGYYLALAQGPAVGLLFGLSRHKYFALVNSVEGIVNLLLSILLVRRYGIVGVALGTLVPMTLSSVIIQPIYVCRMAGIDYFEYVRRTGRTLAIVVGSLVLPVLLSVRFAVPDYIILLSVALVSLGLYVMPLWLLEFSPVETRILLGAVWPQLAMKRAAD
jgi:O-antigen/teichoic acid export membrane protein